MPRKRISETEFDFDLEGNVTNGLSEQDAALVGLAADFNEWRKQQGLAGRIYARGGKKRIHSVFVSDLAYDGLRYLAQAHKAYFGSDPSVSALLEAIGTLQLKVTE